MMRKCFGSRYKGVVLLATAGGESPPASLITSSGGGGGFGIFSATGQCSSSQ